MKINTILFIQEAENLNLKLRLKVGKEALQREREEKDRFKQQLAGIIYIISYYSY